MVIILLFERDIYDGKKSSDLIHQPTPTLKYFSRLLEYLNEENKAFCRATLFII